MIFIEFKSSLEWCITFKIKTLELTLYKILYYLYIISLKYVLVYYKMTCIAIKNRSLKNEKNKTDRRLDQRRRLRRIERRYCVGCFRRV